MASSDCVAMPVDIRAEAMFVNLAARALSIDLDSVGDSIMSIDVGAKPMSIDLDGSMDNVMRVSICSRGAVYEPVTYNGEVVTYNGEPVYVLVEG